MKTLMEKYQVSQRRACGLLDVTRSTLRYEPQRDDSVLRKKLIGLARERPRFRVPALACALYKEKVNRSIISGCGECIRWPG